MPATRPRAGGAVETEEEAEECLSTERRSMAAKIRGPERRADIPRSRHVAPWGRRATSGGKSTGTLQRVYCRSAVSVAGSPRTDGQRLRLRRSGSRSVSGKSPTHQKCTPKACPRGVTTPKNHVFWGGAARAAP